MFHLLNSLILILWYMNLMNSGQMDHGNENPSQYLPWWLRKTTKKPQSGWSAPGFEPGTSRMWVLCVTTERPRSVWSILFCSLLHLFHISHDLLWQTRTPLMVFRRDFSLIHFEWETLQLWWPLRGGLGAASPPPKEICIINMVFNLLP